MTGLAGRRSPWASGLRLLDSARREVIRIMRSGIAAIVGRTNVGKSSLLNTLLEEKVSIVSNVVQTTRNLIRAILTEPRGQVVFLDTPGSHRATNDLGKIMNRSARSAVRGTDLVLVVFDVSSFPYEEDEGWIRRSVREDLPVLPVFNKADLQEDHAESYLRLWREIAEARGKSAPDLWLRTSAATRVGVTQLLDHIFGLLPEGPLLFPEDILTDFPRKLAIGDVVREKLFHALRQELPHDVAVAVTSIDEDPEGWTVHGDVYVNKATQKPIVIGRKGRVLRNARKAAESELAEMYGLPISLDLWVKVQPGWAKNYWILRQLGYV